MVEPSAARAQRNGGFALVELTVATAIVGLLAAIVVLSVRGAQDTGSTAACKADVKTVTVAAEAYNAKNGHYAASMAELVSAGLLHSIPSSATYTVSYSVSDGSATGMQKVAVSSAYCPLDAGSKYCIELGAAHDKYAAFDLAGVDGQALPSVLNSFSRLQGLSTDDDTRTSWTTYSSSYRQVASILERAGLTWNDLKTLDAGQTPKGIDRVTADAVRSDMQIPLNTKEFHTAHDTIAAQAAAVCGLVIG
jgi:general secretion pathway protein G